MDSIMSPRIRSPLNHRVLAWALLLESTDSVIASDLTYVMKKALAKLENRNASMWKLVNIADTCNTWWPNCSLWRLLTIRYRGFQ